MRKTTVPQRVQAFLDKNPKPAQIIAEDVNYPPLIEVRACNYPVVKTTKCLPPF